MLNEYLLNLIEETIYRTVHIIFIRRFLIHAVPNLKKWNYCNVNKERYARYLKKK